MTRADSLAKCRGAYQLPRCVDNKHDAGNLGGIQDNTNLLHEGKDHSTSDLLFDWSVFCLFAYNKINNRFTCLV